MARMDDALRDALADHPALERVDGSYRVTTLAVAATITVEGETIVVEVVLPALGVSVRDAVVPEVVEEEWSETLPRRLEDGYDVARSPPAAPVDVERTPTAVTVRYAIEPTDARGGVADAKALAEFTQGTYVQGAIPGYEYDPPLAELLAGAWDADAS
ncbi:MAG: DUF5813 family protein [Halobacteriota archaeon]